MSRRRATPGESRQVGRYLPSKHGEKRGLLTPSSLLRDPGVPSPMSRTAQHQTGFEGSAPHHQPAPLQGTQSRTLTGDPLRGRSFLGKAREPWSRKTCQGCARWGREGPPGPQGGPWAASQETLARHLSGEAAQVKRDDCDTGTAAPAAAALTKGRAGTRVSASH